MKLYELFLITIAIGNIIVPIIMILRSKHFNRRTKIKRILFTLVVMGFLSGIVIAWVLWKASHRPSL